MKAPDKIYLHRTTGNPRLNDKFYSYKPAKIRDDDKIIEYIHKDALLEWAKEQHDHFHEREKDEIADGSNPDAIFFSGKFDAFKSLIDKLQSL